MMTYKEIWTRLNDIHTEFVGEISMEDVLAAWDKGDHSPCGCSICHLMESITIAEFDSESATIADFCQRFDTWIMNQSETVKLSSALAFGEEYRRLRECILNEGSPEFNRRVEGLAAKEAAANDLPNT